MWHNIWEILCNIWDWLYTTFWGADVTDHISFLSFIGVSIGGCFTLFQWKKNTALKRADYIKELTEKIRTDKDISRVIYMLEYDVRWYSPKFHSGSALERKVDRTLTYFSYILYLKNERIISEKEFLFFKYNLERILRDDQMQDYFYNLYHFSQKQGVPISFEALLKYAKENQLLDADFENPKAYKNRKKYHRYLNF